MLAGHGGGVPPVVGRGRGGAPARMGGPADPACAAALLRLPALCAGMALFAIQELLGHSWTGTTARYIHVHATHVEDAWVAGQQRAGQRWKGLAR